MGLTAQNLIEALTACAGGEMDEFAEGIESESLPEIVLLMRHAQPTYMVTVLSAWEVEGRDLSPALKLELDVARARADYYRSVHANLTSKVTGLSSVKGLEILDLYPEGLTRHLNDIDYVAATESGLWQACDLLMRDGWELYTATFSHFGGGPQVMVSLRRPHEDPFQLPYGIEMTTYYSLGNYGAIRPLVHLPAKWRGAAIKNILMLLYERYEQPFRARDLVDTVLLHDALRGDELAALHEAVVTLSLGVEYNELVELVGRSGLGTLRPLPGKRWTTGTIRVRRLARGASFFLRPVAGTGRQLQRRMITGEISRPEGVLWDAVQRQLPVPAAMSGGLLAFGLPMDGPPPEVASIVLYRRGKLAWADTPAARFLLTLGDFVDEDDVAALAKRHAEPSSDNGLAAEAR
ncbi:MAG TPA: hypothetical protein VNF47_13470 [Streptosporangiaceae bacterium]|nr:hypothetical protein [Streptosporangiaceae bacterium]